MSRTTEFGNTPSRKLRTNGSAWISAHSSDAGITTVDTRSEQQTTGGIEH